MKNRRLVLVAFLLCACMIVGVGYASLIDILDINGTAEYGMAHDIDSEIRFTEAYTYDNDNTTSISSTNNDKITFSVNSLSTEGNVAFFRFKIASSHDEEITLYLSSFGMSGTHSDPESTVDQVYEVKYLFSTDKFESDTSITYDNMFDADKGEGNFTAENNHPLAASNGSTDSEVYVYVAVKLLDAPENQTVTATFAMEIAADVADNTVSE